MSNIYNFEDRAKSHRFNKDIIDVLSAKNSLYEYGQDGDEGIAYLHFKKYVYIFFKYIPRGETTSNPSLPDSMNGIESNERFSSGEWTVDDIIVLKKEDALVFFPIIYNKNKEKRWIYEFKQKVMNKVFRKK